MWRRTPLTDVPGHLSITELIARLGRFDVVVVDLDDTLAPDEAPLPARRRRLAEAHAAAVHAGIPRLLVVSNGHRSRGEPGDGVVWQVNKPWTRAARLRISAGDSVAVVGDRIIPDGLLARRWGAHLYLVPGSAHPGSPRRRRATRVGALIRRALFSPTPLD
jgi:predicted HAD superfamily phosphohydrolase YqeG